MIKQIEEKVVNRLRQVTSAIKQDGANQVSIITSTAERQAAIEFAKAAAMRPQIVGAALQEDLAGPGHLRAPCSTCWKRRTSSKARPLITLIPSNSALLGQLVAASQSRKAEAP